MELKEWFLRILGAPGGGWRGGWLEKLRRFRLLRSSRFYAPVRAAVIGVPPVLPSFLPAVLPPVLPTLLPAIVQVSVDGTEGVL